MPLVTVLFNWGLSKLSFYVDPNEVGPGFVLAPQTSDIKAIVDAIVADVKRTDLLINDDHDAKLICDVYMFNRPGPSQSILLGDNFSYRVEVLLRQGTQRVSVRVSE